MQRYVYIIVLAWFLNFVVLSQPTATCAAAMCSCIVPSPPDQELAESAAVFQGRVIAIEQAQTSVNEEGRAGISTFNRVRFHPTTIWKGASTSEIIIATGSGGGDCGYQFIQGNEYLVYARSSSGGLYPNMLSTNICSRTQPVGLATDDIRALNAVATPAQVSASPTSTSTPVIAQRPPVSEPTTPTNQQPDAGALLIPGMAVGALLALATVFAIRRFNR